MPMRLVKMPCLAYAILPCMAWEARRWETHEKLRFPANMSCLCP